MDLFIKDRLYIPQFLPKENSLVQFGLKKSIMEKIFISEKEVKAVGLAEDEATKLVKWDVKKDKGVKVDFSKEELTYLKESCETMVDKPLPDDMWVVIEKIYEAAK